MEKEKYEKPDLTVLNDNGSELDPQPMGLFLPPLFVVAAAVFVLVAGVYSVAGAVEIAAAVSGVTAVTSYTTVV